MNAIAALLTIAEIMAFCLAGFVWLRRQKHSYSVPAALALGIASGLALLSFIFQAGFLARLPDVIPLLEIMALLGLGRLTWGQWGAIDDIRKQWVSVWLDYPAALTALAIAFSYLGLQAILLPPSSWDALTYHLPRVLLWEQNRSLFLQDFTISPQAAFPVGSDILFHAFLRFQTDYGLGLFSVLSYLIILFGVYALVRHRVSRTLALTTAIAIACLPEIVYQATATKNDIIMAAIALACVLWADRWLQISSVESLIGLGLMLCFGVSVKTSFVLFAFFFVPLWLSMVIQKGRLSCLLQAVSKEWRIGALSMIPGLVFSQIWLFAYNHQRFGEWLGPPEFALNNQNNDNLWGAIANLTRYSIHSFHLLHPVDHLSQSLTGESIVSGLQSLYDRLFAPLFGDAGKAEYLKGQLFEIKWLPQEDTSWFGPVSVFLVIPSVVWGLAKGRNLSRVMAIVAIALVLAISYKLGWSPWKSRFFTITMICAAPCVADILERLPCKVWSLLVVRWLSIAILIYASLLNYNKALIPSSNENVLGRVNIWIASDWTRNRTIYDMLYRGDRIAAMTQELSSATRVAIVGYDLYFSTLFENPHLTFVLLRTESSSDEIQSLAEISDRLTGVDHLLCFRLPCDPSTTSVGLEKIWESQFDGGVPQIYRVLTPQKP